MTDPTRRQTAALVEAGMILASELDLAELLKRIADLAREVVGARYAAVGVLGDEAELGEFVYSGLDQAAAEKIGDLPRGRGVLGLLIEQDKPLRLHDISSHPRSYGFPENHPPMSSFLGVPITVRDQVFGRLYLTEKQGGAEFTKDDERIALTLASQAGIAVENARLYEEVRTRGEILARRMAELASVGRVGGLIIGEGSVEETLASAVSEAGVLTGASKSALLLVDRSTNELFLRQCAGDIEPHRIGAPLPSDGSRAYSVVARGQADIFGASDGDPGLESDGVLGTITNGALVPLIVRARALGALGVYNRDDDFARDDVTILQSLANQIAIALENERLSDALRDLAVLEERERISRELHDGVIQSIYSVGLSLQGSLSVLERDPGRAVERIDAAISELDNVVRDVRSYIFELRPKEIEEGGIEAAVRELARDLEVNTLAHVTVEMNEQACDDLAVEALSHVVQVVREVLSNIARHSQASEVAISCSPGDNGTELTITDNGVGFDVDNVRRGNGLTNMEERARSLGGVLRIESAAGKGARHRLQIPTRQGDEALE